MSDYLKCTHCGRPRGNPYKKQMTQVIENLTYVLELLDAYGNEHGRISSAKAIIEKCIEAIRRGENEN